LLPQVHQAYFLVDRVREAIDLAESAGDLQFAVPLLLQQPGEENAVRALTLAEKWGDAGSVRAASHKVGLILAMRGDHAKALSHFKKAEQWDLAADSFCALGEFGEGIRIKTAITSEWLEQTHRHSDAKVQHHLASKEFKEAVAILFQIRGACSVRGDSPLLKDEAVRVERLLGDLVRTVRGTFEEELRSANSSAGAEVFKRWSLFEEAAGNFLEAALHAESAQDFFSASLLFEKAGAIGQAIRALDKSGNAGDLRMRAGLLEQGGDSYTAGMLYERLGDLGKAVEMFEAAKEFTRAAQVRRAQVGEKQAVFDEKLLNLLVKAGRVESLADLALVQLHEPGCQGSERLKLADRLRHLNSCGYLGAKWEQIIAEEGPSSEDAYREKFFVGAEAWFKTAAQEVQETYLDAFGMDLGTSNSTVALFNRKSKAAEVAEIAGRASFPSVFAIDDTGREIIGVATASLLTRPLRALITRAKRIMGSDKSYRADGTIMRPEEVSGRLLRYGQQVGKEFLLAKITARVEALAFKALGTPAKSSWIADFLKEHPQEIGLNRAVLTVPAYFNDSQKQATRMAAEFAGIKVLRLIHEPTAACLAQSATAQEPGNVLVIDLGAGTLDLSLIQVDEGIHEVTEIQGDNTLGGADVDDLLLKHFNQVLLERVAKGVLEDKQRQLRLKDACERLKIELSNNESWSIPLLAFNGQDSIDISLGRKELEAIASPWLDRFRAVCKRIKGKPDRILLVGGAGQMPAVRSCVREAFGINPIQGVDPVASVARGAAIQAGILCLELKGILLLDVVPFSLGVGVTNPDKGIEEISFLIPKHKTIPTKNSRDYTTVTDNQSIVSINVFQGENRDPKDNFKVGHFDLDGIPPAPKGTPNIEVSFSIDADCCLEVTAKDKGTGKTQSITIRDSHLLSPAQKAATQKKFREEEGGQATLSKLQAINDEILDWHRRSDIEDVPVLAERFGRLLAHYEANAKRFSPRPSDDQVLMEIFRERLNHEGESRYSTEQWKVVIQDGKGWLERRKKALGETPRKADVLQGLLAEGTEILSRTDSAYQLLSGARQRYGRWLAVLQDLPLNPTGDPDELARHFLVVGQADQALSFFKRLPVPLKPTQVDLGLKILAALRKKDEYNGLLGEHLEALNVHVPNFSGLNHTVRQLRPSVVWVQVIDGSGSGFAIGPNLIATNRHVVVNKDGKAHDPSHLRVLTTMGPLPVVSVHLSQYPQDDVAILRLADGVTLAPLRLGFSELVEVGERVIALGFPAPEDGGFEENLHLGSGLVNRIRAMEAHCSERVFELSLDLKGGISGAPVINEQGEVIGLATFAIYRPEKVLDDGQVTVGKASYAVPVNLLRKLMAGLQ
jgi:molecular chaperone DnaK